MPQCALSKDGHGIKRTALSVMEREYFALLSALERDSTVYYIIIVHQNKDVILTLIQRFLTRHRCRMDVKTMLCTYWREIICGTKILQKQLSTGQPFLSVPCFFTLFFFDWLNCAVKVNLASSKKHNLSTQHTKSAKKT